MRTPRTTRDRRRRAAIVAIALLAIAAALWAIWRSDLPFDSKLHAQRVERLRAAQAAHDVDAEARINAELAREGNRCARACVLAWSALRDEETGFFPRGGDEKDEALIWNGQDTAADLFPHMLYAAIRVAPEEETTWRAVLAAERRWADGPFPRRVRLQPAAVVEESEEDRLQNAAEYAADGLVPLVERLGDGPWLDRLHEIADAVVARAAVESGRGPIPSTSAETNGNLLQVLARLQPLTRNPRQLEMAERIASWYAIDVLPRNGNLPPRAWDIATNRPDQSDVKLRDHGGEVIPGLGELYLFESGEDRDFAAALRPPFEAMLGALIRVERTRDGLWLEDVVPATGKAGGGRGGRVVDTWGYLTNAFVMADLADAGAASAPPNDGRRSEGRFAPEVERVMRSVSLARDVPWEPGTPHDGYADAIESMLCLLPFRHVEGAAEWIDREIARMLDLQHRDGFVGRQYLDGNFVRTAMLYAEWKTRGARLEPWRDDVWIGGAGDGPTGEHLRLHVSADTPWSGRLCLDAARHRTHWNMKTEYPRRNGSPEWFTVEAGRSYAVRDLDTGTSTTHDGAELIEGIPLALEPGRGRRLVVEAL